MLHVFSHRQPDRSACMKVSVCTRTHEPHLHVMCNTSTIHPQLCVVLFKQMTQTSKKRTDPLSTTQEQKFLWISQTTPTAKMVMQTCSRPCYRNPYVNFHGKPSANPYGNKGATPAPLRSPAVTAVTWETSGSGSWRSPTCAPMSRMLRIFVEQADSSCGLGWGV